MTVSPCCFHHAKVKSEPVCSNYTKQAAWTALHHVASPTKRTCSAHKHSGFVSTDRKKVLLGSRRIVLMHTQREIHWQWCRYMQYFLILGKRSNPQPLSFHFSSFCLPNKPYPLFICFGWFGLCLHALSKRRWSGSACLWQNEAVRVSHSSVSSIKVSG